VSEEPWLRGPVEGVIVELQPVAHELLFAKEELARIFEGVHDADVWQRPGGIAPIGYHVRHCSGSTLRMLTYARGESLSEAQFAAFQAENTTDPTIGRAQLLRIANDAIDSALEFVKAVEPFTLDDKRFVGRKKLQSSVRGLLFEIATHTSRHLGQIATTARLLSSDRDRDRDRDRDSDSDSDRQGSERGTAGLSLSPYPYRPPIPIPIAIAIA